MSWPERVDISSIITRRAFFEPTVGWSELQPPTPSAFWGDAALDSSGRILAVIADNGKLSTAWHTPGTGWSLPTGYGMPGEVFGEARVAIDGLDRGFLITQKFLTQDYYGPRELRVASLIDGTWATTELGPVDSSPKVSIATAPDGLWLIAAGRQPHVQTLAGARSKPTWLYRYSAAQGWAPSQIAIEPVENCQLGFCPAVDATLLSGGNGILVLGWTDRFGGTYQRWFMP
jgi:hypothetical protein